MKTKLVVVPNLKRLIHTSPGFAKKGLADFKLDIVELCEFGCSYCSSNAGNVLRINREPLADLTETQTGKRTYPADDPALMFVWTDVEEQLEAELASKPKKFGAGKTLVFSMLTDGFSPTLVARGVTERTLSILLERTSFRIRILTKNAVVGSPKWIRFFEAHRDRFVVGLSTGSLDRPWARAVERRTSSTTARLAALRKLQDAGVPTYGMLCPVFPATLGDDIAALVEGIRSDVVEEIWAEPYNDRLNWRRVRDAFAEGSADRAAFETMFDGSDPGAWSAYAAELYRQLRRLLGRHSIGKLRYLLYEGNVLSEHADAFTGLEGVLLQGKPGEDGCSKNAAIAGLQKTTAIDDTVAAPEVRALTTP
jgi:DNA repair photolyase